MKLPPHPQRNDDQQTAAGINWVAVAVIAIVIAVAVVLVHPPSQRHRGARGRLIDRATSTTPQEER